MVHLMLFCAMKQHVTTATVAGWREKGFFGAIDAIQPCQKRIDSLKAVFAKERYHGVSVCVLYVQWSRAQST